MSKPGAKQTALQNALTLPPPGGSRLSGLRDRRFLELVLATTLLFIGAFLAWQAWLVFTLKSGAVQAQDVSDWEVKALAGKISEIRLRAQQAVNSDAVTTALSSITEASSAAALEELRRAMPELISADFYRPDISEVLASDFAKFGYTKAALVVKVHQLKSIAPLQTIAHADKHRVLTLALPVLHDTQLVAFAYLELPLEPLLHVFRQPGLSGARVDLRQGDGHSDVLIDSIGSSDSLPSLSSLGTAIPDSMFRVGMAQPEFFIVTAFGFWWLVLLAIIGLGAGSVLLYVRQVGWQHVKERLQRGSTAKAGVEQTMAQSLRKAQENAPIKSAVAIAKALPPAKPKEVEVSVDRSIFRAYDIRGVLGKTLTKSVARQIGRAIGSEAQQRGLKDIVVGRDGRLSGPELSAALIEGLRSAGCDVIDIGAVPTPVLYFATFHLNTGSGVEVTGSHNPPDYNGFKIVLGGETLAETAIQDLFARISEQRFSSGSGGLQTMDVSRDYIERITDDVQLEKKLKVVVDCGNGIPGAIVPAVLEGIGCDVQPIYCDVDGNFPNHHPDPSDPHNLQDLILSVKQLKADIGLAFDGDGDRLGVVTASGEIIYPDRVLMLFAKDVLSRNPGATIIYDVKCTGKLQPLILQAGGSPIMWKTGHSLIKSKMRETDAELAGEMSGHFFFRERWYGFDDGIYSAARLLEILAGDIEGRNPQQIFDSLPKGVSTPELKIEMREGEHYAFIERFREKSGFPGARVTTIDGIRADWPDGWGLVRASNTTPVLVLRFDADNEAALRRIKDAFRAQLLALDAKLALPF